MSEGPNRNYEEELAAQTAMVDKAKEHYETAKAEVDHLKEQATKCEADLQQLLEARTAQLRTT